MVAEIMEGAGRGTLETLNTAPNRTTPGPLRPMKEKIMKTTKPHPVIQTADEAVRITVEDIRANGHAHAGPMIRTCWILFQNARCVLGMTEEVVALKARISALDTL